MNNKIKNISTLAIFLSLTVILNVIIQFLTIPPFGRMDFTHLPTIVLAITNGPIIAATNAFFADIIGAMLRGYAPWLQISLARGIQGLIAGYLVIWWKKSGNELNIIFTTMLFIILFFGIEFIGYAEAYRFYTKRAYSISASIFYTGRALKTPIMLPIWIGIVKYFAKK